VVDEHAARLLLPAQHAVAIRQMFGRYGIEEFSLIGAGGDVFARAHDGGSVASAYRQCGFHLRPALGGGRVQGWAGIMQMLGDPAAGLRPKLYVHERCTRLIETLPSLQRDPANPEDVLKVDCDEEGIGGDDAADALRYLLALKPRQFGAAVI
jgi:hypothetical protein